MSDSSVVGRLLRFVFFIAILVFAWSEGWPWLQKQIAGGGSPCMASAQDITDDFAREMHRFADRRTDADGWKQLYVKMDTRLGIVRQQCGCDLPSCRKGRQAVNRLEKLILSFHHYIGGGSAVVNPQGVIAEIDAILKEGYALARKGE